MGKRAHSVRDCASLQRKGGGVDAPDVRGIGSAPPRVSETAKRFTWELEATDGPSNHASEAFMYATYEQANELMAVCLFSVLGLVLSAAVISIMPADAMSLAIAQLHLGMTSGH